MSGQNDIPLVFDKALVRARRARALAAGPELFLLERAAEDAATRLALTKRTFELALEIGAAGQVFGQTAQAHGLLNGEKIRRLMTCEGSAPLARNNGADFACNEEALPLAEGSLDLIVSLLMLQWTNDLPGALTQIRRALKPDGLFLGAVIGGESLTELRQALAEAEIETLGGMSPRVAPMADVKALGGLLQRAGFALPVVDLDRVTLTYEHPLRLLADLRAMGATNALADRHKRPLPRATLFRALEIYTERFSQDGRITATIDIVHLSGWAPHASQPKPLRPGSATSRLADALGTVEVPLKDSP